MHECPTGVLISLIIKFRLPERLSCITSDMKYLTTKHTGVVVDVSSIVECMFLSLGIVMMCILFMSVEFARQAQKAFAFRIKIVC